MNITLRIEAPGDADFLRGLIIESIEDELMASLWPEPLRTQIVQMQFSLRRNAYRSTYADAVSQIIQSDGQDAGWIVQADEPDHLCIVEIMIARSLRNGGIGSAVLQMVLSCESRRVRLRVNVMNAGAARFYERHGFRRVSSDGVQDVMEWSPSTLQRGEKD